MSTDTKKKKKSGNPAVRAEAAASDDRKVVMGASSAKDFKKLKKGKTLLLPSGLSLVCRRVELSSFINQGEVPNPLLPLVEEALNKGKAMDPREMMIEDSLDLDKVKEMYELVNAIILEMVVSPKVHPLPTHDDDGEELQTLDEIEAAKDDDLLYIDEIDETDKMFLFQWSTGGTEDVARFREEAEAGLAGLVQGKGKRKKSK